MADTEKPLKWIPRRFGPRARFYCSPACGGWKSGLCTTEAHRKAKAGAAALAKRLGPGWRPDVWENLGWYYRVVSPCRRVSVHPGALSKAYSAYLGRAGETGGRWSACAKTPEEAIADVSKKARDDLAQYGAAFADLPIPARSRGKR